MHDDRSGPGGSPTEGTLLATYRRWLLALVSIGMIGTAVELLFLAHDEDTQQLIPLVVIAAAVLAIGAWALTRRPWTLHAVRAMMLALVVSGIAGIVLHFQANAEFQREMDPNLSGLSLAWTVLQAKSPPSLAPANLALLGCLGALATLGVRPSSSSVSSSGD